MSTYTVTVTDKLEPVLEHLRLKDGSGALTKDQYVQHFVTRALENHAINLRDPTLDAVVALSDEEFASLGNLRIEKIKERDAPKPVEAEKETTNEAEVQPAPGG